ncbi:hypothetical protein UlMin_045777 [Ulmus minor]
MGAGSSQYEACQAQPSEEQSKNFENQSEAKPSSFDYPGAKAVGNIYGKPSSSDYQIAKAVGNTSEAKPNDNKAKAAEKIPAGKHPHSFEAITKEADIPIDKSSIEKLQSQLQAGISLNHRRKKYWVDGMYNNCFMLYARDLSITWAEDKRYWRWLQLKETSDELIDTAELLNVCWLEIHGKFETTKLSPGTSYEVVFVVMLKDPAYGWDVPVNVRLVLPDGSKQEHKVNLMEKPRGQWINIPAGEFRTSPEKPGEIEFSIYEYEGGIWKKGLVIKGVKIQPKK